MRDGRASRRTWTSQKIRPRLHLSLTERVTRSKTKDFQVACRVQSTLQMSSHRKRTPGRRRTQGQTQDRAGNRRLGYQEHPGDELIHPLMLSVGSKSRFYYAIVQTQRPIHLNAKHYQASEARRAEGIDRFTEHEKENKPVGRTDQTERTTPEHATRA